MSLPSDRARIEFLLSMIHDIEIIAQRHGGAAQALEDIEGHHALMMCLLQIGETMGKLQDKNTVAALPIALASGLRNVIAHDYMGLSPRRIVDTLTISIPELKQSLQKLA